MKKLLLFYFIGLFASDVYSFNDSLKIDLQPPPAINFNITQLWNMTLVNSTSSSYQVKFKATASKNNVLLVTAYTSVIMLPSNSRMMINASYFQQITVGYENNTDNFQNIVEGTGTFPAGNYEICVEMKSPDDILFYGGDCEPLFVQSFSEVHLISPLKGTDVQDLYPVFSWLPPTPVPGNQNLNYILSIYEILSRQTPYNATQSNPAFFQSPRTRTTVFRYPAVSRNFTGGKRYAVKVSAYIDTVLISISDVNDFTYVDSVFNGSNELNKLKKQNDKKRISLNSASNMFTQSEKIFDYGVNSSVYFEAANKPAVFSELLKTYGRIDIMPEISFYGIPFGVNFFFATDNSSARQNMNNLEMFFNPKYLKEMVQDKVEEKLISMKDEIERKVKEGGEESRDNIESVIADEVKSNLAYPLKLFSQFQNLGIGNNYPYYTDYTLSGVSVTGINLEFNPGQFYVAFTGPVNNRAVENTTYKRDLYSARLGYGKVDNSHIFLTGLYAKDDEQSIYVNPDNTFLTPKENRLFGIEGKLFLMNDKLKFEGESAVSVYTDDTQAAELISESLPEWLKNISNLKISSRYDYFYKFGASYDIDQTKSIIKANFIWVGPGYISLGSPNKPNDLMEYKISLDQKLYNNQVTAKISLLAGRDNLMEGYKSYTTKNTILNIGLNLRFKNYPNISLNYYPVFLKNDAPPAPYDSSEFIDNVNQNMTFLASYPFKFSGLNNNASVFFSWNNADTYLDSNNNFNWSLNITDNISFKIPLIISAGFGIIKSKGYDTLTTYTIDFNGSYTSFEVWMNTLGFNITTSPDNNQSLLFYINSSASFLKYFNIDARLEKSIYDDYGYSAFNNNELIFKSTLSVAWK